MSSIHESNRYKIYQWPHPLFLVWVVIPIFAISEIVFGKRIPSVCMIDRASGRSSFQSQLIPCPHCGSIHDGLLWSGKNALGHWFGLFCPNCRQTIPSLQNFTSLVILFFLSPLCRILRERYGEQYRSFELARLDRQKVNIPLQNYSKVWIRAGLRYGILMSIFFLLRSDEFSFSRILASCTVGLMSGMCFSLIMWFFQGRAKKSE